MFLGIDTSKKDIVRLTLFDKESVFEKQVDAKNRDLLFYIDEFLTEQKIEKKDVQGIAVVVGEGGFTSTRIATTVANGFVYIHKIPVISISSDDLKNTQELISKFESQQEGKYISATYSGEPNIG